jgi:predicted transcriptional regulator
MLTKERLNKTIEELPESFTIDELIERLIVVEKIEKGIRDSDEGKVIAHGDVLQIINQWSK